jgi:hypothetical protein
VIWAPSFEGDAGGIIALHALCERLNGAGIPSAIWPTVQAPPMAMLNLPNPKAVAGYYLKRKAKTYSQGPFANPVATRRDVQDGIIVYPEIVAGNPLRAQRVVRWLLHKPGHHTGIVSYAAEDLFFVYHEHFADPSLAVDQTHRLTVTWVNQAYQDRGYGNRSGACLLLRKGRHRPLAHHHAAASPVDGLGHQEMAEVFNRTERLYSYDPYTLYNVYAAICGCVPVIIPEAGVSKEQWLPKPEDRYGLAYGEEDIAWAIATRELMLARFRRVREEEEDMLTAFVARCERRYGLPL